MPVIDTPITTNAQSVERIIQNALPSVLVFYDRALPPALDQSLKTIAKQDANQVLIAKLSLADDPSLRSAYGVTTTPTLIAYQQQGEVARLTNAAAENAQALVDYLLGRREDLPQQHAPSPNASNSVKPVKVTDADFKQIVLDSDVPVLVDFWAEWCMPCHMIAPSLEKIAAAFPETLTVAKLNVDENQTTAMQHRIQGIPALKLFKNGRVVDELVGVPPNPEAALRQFVAPHLA
jgi:thioredoxin 1